MFISLFLPIAYKMLVEDDMLYIGSTSFLDKIRDAEIKVGGPYFLPVLLTLIKPYVFRMGMDLTRTLLTQYVMSTIKKLRDEENITVEQERLLDEYKRKFEELKAKEEEYASLPEPIYPDMDAVDSGRDLITLDEFKHGERLVDPNLTAKKNPDLAMTLESYNYLRSVAPPGTQVLHPATREPILSVREFDAIVPKDSIKPEDLVGEGKLKFAKKYLKGQGLPHSKKDCEKLTSVMDAEGVVFE
jgi:hypothetical protein